MSDEDVGLNDEPIPGLSDFRKAQQSAASPLRNPPSTIPVQREGNISHAPLTGLAEYRRDSGSSKLQSVDTLSTDLRSELLGRLVAAQFELEAAIAKLRAGNDSVGVARSELSLSDVLALQRSVATASPTALAGMRGEIIAAAASVTREAQQAASSNAVDAASQSLAQASTNARVTVRSVMDGMKDFDPELRFASREDEEAYRRRDAETKALIEAELAKGTPAGDLNASGAAMGQMLDADAHCAGASPEFQQRWKALVSSTERLRDEVRRSGGSTKEFDDRLRTELRRILKTKGLSDTQIDAQFAANPDPLEAAKAFMASEDELRAVRQSAERIAATAPPVIVRDDTPVSDKRMDDATAKLRAAGLMVGEHRPEDPPAHGVVADSRTTSAAVRLS